MTKLLGFVGGFAGSSLGWALGAPLGVFGAYVLSTAGLGLGLYAGRRLGGHLGG